MPIDGVVTEGASSIDEPIPVKKQKGNKVIGATVNKTGSFTMQAEKVGCDTLLSQIVRMVTEAQRS